MRNLYVLGILIGALFTGDLWATHWIYNIKNDTCEPYKHFDMADYFLFRKKKGDSCSFKQHPDEKFYVVSCISSKDNSQIKEKIKERMAKNKTGKASSNLPQSGKSLIIGRTFQACNLGRNNFKRTKAKEAEKKKAESQNKDQDKAKEE